MKQQIKIERTEQWEYTAYGYGMSATGSSEISAKANLLEIVTEKFFLTLVDIAVFGHKNPGCGFSCSEKAKKAIEDYTKEDK